MLEINKIYEGDCLEVMKQIDDNSIDLVLCDLPYGTTACKWDTIIPFEPLWKQYKRIIKDNGAIVLTASQPFTSILVMSNIEMFKYEWIWIKSHPSNSLLAKKQPLKYHENIVVFYNMKPTYNPQFTVGNINHSRKRKDGMNSNILGAKINIVELKYDGKKYPKSYIQDNSYLRGNLLHPTQKPVALFEYLIKTYTNEGDLVLDNCAGSGTTGVACQNLNRNYILIEKEPKYYDIILKRLSMINKQKSNEICGWLEYKTDGIWTKEDGKRFCYKCGKMIKPGDRVLEHVTSPHRGGRGHWSYAHIGGCPN